MAIITLQVELTVEGGAVYTKTYTGGGTPDSPEDVDQNAALTSLEVGLASGGNILVDPEEADGSQLFIRGAGVRAVKLLNGWTAPATLASWVN